ncbi:MAG TPA: hypothetical protein VEB21_19000 [Terriglobales bacterium]|nr:hypothetical protein [Terriglobales bacterium]
MDAIRGHCEFEPIHPADLLGAISSLEGSDGTGIHVPHPGEGVDKLISWAIADVRSAESAGDKVDRERFASNAILHARRALSCLADWYMRRDCFVHCNNPPTTARQQSEILLRRGIVDGLTSRVLERAVAKRNEIEHEYVAPAVETAEDIVELLRRTIDCLSRESDPRNGPCFFGNFFHSLTTGRSGTSAEFFGWGAPSCVLCTFDSQAWIGIIIPSDKKNALVRRCPFSEISRELLLDVLACLEYKFGRHTGGAGSREWSIKAQQAGLLDHSLSNERSGPVCRA